MIWLQLICPLLLLMMPSPNHCQDDILHSHSMLENVLGAHDDVQEDVKERIVSENDVLLEEVIESAKNIEGDLFDSHVGDKERGRQRRKRQVNQEDIKEALCKDKNPGEFFRLVAGEHHCRDVVACADHGLQAIRCSPGLAFDLRKQTCEWRQEVDMIMFLLIVSF